MKKTILTCFSLLAFIAVQAQSPRVVLLEEFTSGTCGPSSADDPAIDTLVFNNSSKVVAVKYQGPPFPTADALYLQNPTDVTGRTNYYSVTYVPYARINGVIPGPSIPNVFNLNQFMIDTMAMVPSAFSLNITDSIDPLADSLHIRVVITCTQNITAISPMLRISVNESWIHFDYPPNAAIMHDYHDVMRIMVPNYYGTALPTSWTVGNVLAFNFTIPMPSYIYRFDQISVVAWIQDDANKSVLQAGKCDNFSGPMIRDAGIPTVLGIDSGNCDTTVFPVVIVKNYGDSVLTSCTINYSVDGGSVQTQNWSGNLVSGQTDSVALAGINSGSILMHDLYVYTTAPNNNLDWNNSNNGNHHYFILSNPSLGGTPALEGFQGGTFPPHNWGIINPDYNETWINANYGGYALSTKSARINFYYIPNHEKDYLYMNPLDLSALLGSNYLSFDVACAQYLITDVDTLMVEISSDCGASWIPIYIKAGTQLSTTSPQIGLFAPNSNQWRTDSVDIGAWAGLQNILIRFVGISDYGNALFLDNINIDGLFIGIEEPVSNSQVEVYPNPFNASTRIDMENLPELILQPSVFELYNGLGEKIMSKPIQQLVMEIERGNLASGIYFYTLTAGNKMVHSGKLVVE